MDAIAKTLSIVYKLIYKVYLPLPRYFCCFVYGIFTVAFSYNCFFYFKLF